MYIWNVIRAWFQERIQDMGVDETSFPMFLSAKSLEKVSSDILSTLQTGLELTVNRRSMSAIR